MPIIVDGKRISEAAQVRVVEDGFVGISRTEERVEFDGTGDSVNIIGADFDIRGGKYLKLSDSNSSDSVSIKAHDTTTAYSLTFPAAQSSANQVLINNGSGVLTWVNHQADNPTFTNLTVTGNLDVQGATTQLDTTSSIVKDKTLALGVPGGMVEASCVTNGTIATITSTGHSISSTESVYIDADANGTVPTGVYIATSTGADTFTIPTTSASASARTIYHSIDDSTDATANGSGIVIPAASELKSITYSSANDKFITSESFEASSFIKTSGTASEFLKADGSVDSSVYITGVLEADVTQHQAALSITESQISDLQSYLTSETSHADVLVDGDFSSAGLMKTNGSGTYSVGTDNSSNWDTAHGWGNHASAGYLTSETNNLSSVTGTLAIANGGTGATTAAGVRTNIDLDTTDNVQFGKLGLGVAIGAGAVPRLQIVGRGSTGSGIIATRENTSGYGTYHTYGLKKYTGSYAAITSVGDGDELKAIYGAGSVDNAGLMKIASGIYTYVDEPDISNYPPSQYKLGGRLAFLVTPHDSGNSDSNSHGLVERMTIRESGNVGIGTASPDTSHHVYQATGTTLVRTETAANSTTGFDIKKTGTTTQHWRIADGQTTNGKLEFYDVTDSRSVMTFDGSGNVGIGTASPQSILDIKGGDTSGETLGTEITIHHTNNNTNDNIGRITFRNNSADNLAAIQAYTVGANTQGELSFWIDNDEKVRIDNDGDVGIGTTTPQQKLEVRGGITTEADSYTKLLIHSDDTSNTTVFTDYSPSSHALTRNNVAHSSTQKKFGSTSIYFDGTDDWIEVADSTDWNFGAPSGNTNDFTIEFWWKDDGSANGDGIISIGHDSTYTTNEAILVYKNGSNLELYSSTGVASGGDVINGAQMGAYGSDWNHYAIVRSGTSWTCYQNGIQISVNTNITAEPRSDVNTFYVGRRVSSTGTCATGYLDELRISKGIARWTSAFTPPNRPYSTINDEFVADLDNLNTTLTVNDGSVGIGDSTPATKLDVNGVITATGGNSTNWNTAHGWGDHSGAGYLTSETNDLSSVTNTLAIANGGTGATTASDALTNLGLGSTSTPSFGDSLTLTSTSTSNAANPSLTLFRDSSSPADDDSMGRIIFSGNDAAGNLTYYSQLIAESESVTSSGERGALWSYSTLNGTSVKCANLAWATASVNGIEINNNGQLFGLGVNANGQLGFYADGLDGSRVLLLDDEDGQPIFTFTEENGTAILEGGDTSITAHKPLISTKEIRGESDSYTKLLIHSDTVSYSTSFIDSSPSGHTVTANSASHQGVQKKFGGTSIFFDGTDDYLSLPDSADFDVGAGDYTFDCWYYPTSVDTTDGIFEFGNISATTQSMVGFGLFADLDSYGLRVHHGTGASSNLDTNETLTANQWYHIAVIRSSGTLKIFVDGVEKASQTMNQSIGQGTNSAYIGRAVHSTHYVNGYLDEVRFSKGIARWTSSFIPPSRPYSTVNDEFFADIEKGVVVTDNNDDANYDVTFTNGVNGLLEDNGEFYYNPNTGTLRVPNLTVNGTTTTVDTVEMQAANAIVFEGATPDAFETTLTITDPTVSDKTITLPDATGTVVTTGNLTDITTVGTIATGTWQGTAIANAYFEDATTFVDTGGTGLTKTGSTLDVDASQSQITGLGTITTGTWAASVIDKAYLATDISSLGTVTACTGLDIQGALTATTKSFNIEHPTKEGKRLVYGSLEGEEHGVYTRGRLSGEDTIDLPDHWTGLVDENSITVQLTAVGSRQDLWVEKIYDNKIKIGSSKMPIACFYLVHAERKDVGKLEVEVDA